MQINKAIKFFKKNELVEKEIKQYISDSIAQSKWLKISKENLPLSFKKKIVKKEGNQHRLIDEYFFLILKDSLKKKLGFGNINSYEKFNSFLIESQDFLSQINGSIISSTNFNMFLFIYFNTTRNWNFQKFTNGLDSESKDNRFFIIRHSISKSIPFLILSTTKLYNIICSLFESSNNDFSDGEYSEALRKFSKKQADGAWKLLHEFLKNKKRKFIPPLLIGLSSSDFQSVFEFTLEILKEPEYSSTAIISLGSINYPNKTKIIDALEVLSEISLENERHLSALARAYGMLLHKEQVEIDEKLIKDLVKRIKEIEQLKYPEALNNVLFTVFRDNKKISEHHKKEILKYYVDISTQYGGIVNQVAFALRELSVDNQFEFIIEWVLNHPEEGNYEIFENTLHSMYSNNKSSFLENFILLLIHDRWQVRQFANSMTEFLELNQQNFKNWKNHVLNLDLNQSVRFIDSVLLGIFNIKNRIKLVLLLLHKKEDNLSEYMLKKFRVLVFDYGEMVIKVVRNELNNEDEYFKKFINNIDEHTKNLIGFWDKKNEVKEFSPLETHSKNFYKYQKLHYKKQQREISKGAESKSVLMSVVKKVSIGRGFESLAQIRTSFLMPRSYFIYPEFYNFNYNQIIHKDWEN